MNQSDYDNFINIMQLVAEQYNKKLSEGLLSLYWNGLKNHDFDAVRDAVGRHLANADTGQYMPKIADILRMMEGTSLDSALAAWAKIDIAIKQIGPYESVVFDDPIIHRVLHDMGGWLMLGTKSEDEWPFVAKEFENRYRGIKSRGTAFTFPAKLIGLAEAHNSNEGFVVENPILIGETKAAQNVFSGGASGSSMLKITRMVIDKKLTEVLDFTGKKNGN